MMNHLTKGISPADLKVEQKKNDFDQCMQQCQEIYQPPGVIKPIETNFEQASKIEKDIRMAIPTDTLFKRKKVAEIDARKKQPAA